MSTYTAPGSAVGSGAHLKCLYTNEGSLRDQLDELETFVLLQSYDIIDISETQDKSHNWNAGISGYWLFRNVRQGRQGGGVTLYVKEIDCTALAVRDDVENF